MPFEYSHTHEIFGRDNELTQIAEFFQSHNRVAICGLGGVGKTRLAVEYAKREKQNYTAVFGLSAARDFDSEFANLAPDLGGKIETQEQQIAFVKDWFKQHENCLVMIDNADDERLTAQQLNACFPNTCKLLITTQHQANIMKLRFACQPLPLYSFEIAQGAAFLLQVSEKADTAENRDLALNISKDLTGLPLALAQAVAYLFVHQCSLADYQRLYQNSQLALLNPDEHAKNIPDHELPVFKTFQLSFSRLADDSKQLLQYCAFLDVAAIPEEILTKLLTLDELELNRRLKPALSYNLLQRNEHSHTLSLHRLVAEVLLLELPEQTQRELAEQVLNAVTAVFPYVEFKNWDLCERFLNSGLACYRHIISTGIETETAARLLNKLAYYLNNRKADYARALPLYQQSIDIKQKVLGTEHPSIATGLNNLATLYETQRQYDLALPLYQQALAIKQKVLDAEHPSIATSLNNLAELYRVQEQYDLALPLYQQALAIRQKVLGAEHPDIAQSLNNLAGLYDAQGQYELALSLYQQSLAIWQKVLGAEHPDTAISLNNLARLYYDQGQYDLALPLYQQALAIRQKVLGAEHPDTAQSLNNLAYLYDSQGQYNLALPLYQQALAIWQKVLGTEHPDTATSLNNLAGWHYALGQYDLALPLYQQALAICQKVLGVEHPDTATSLNNLARLYEAQEQYDLALPLYAQALTILQTALGEEHPNTKTCAENYQLALQASRDNIP